MGELFRIENIVIKMYNYDTDKHKEPHFHAYTNDGKSCVLSISDGTILAGNIERKEKKILIAWIILHKEELWDRWNKAVAGKYIEKISSREF